MSGQFAPVPGGQFTPESGGQFNSVSGGQFDRFFHLIKTNIENIPFTFQYFENATFDSIRNKTVYGFFDEEAERLKLAGSINYSNTFKSTKNVIFKYCNNKELRFSDIDYNFLIGLENLFHLKGIKLNTINVYFRTLRTIFNSAIKCKLCKEENYPFLSRNNPNGYSFSKLKQETQKRAITIEQMRLIKDFQAKEGTLMFHSKNYFMFSFYCMGMNFNDIAKLKWANINNGRIEYVRSKTGGLFSIKVNNEIKGILTYYKNIKQTEFVFPILKPEFSNPEQQFNRIKKTLKAMNDNLGLIAESTGIDFTITSYVARHSWATIQKNKGTSIPIIGEGLGHKTEAQTSTYLKKFENSVLDEVNKDLL